MYINDANHYTTDAVQAMNAFVYNKIIDDAGKKGFRGYRKCRNVF
jgi:hypothetical protein